MNNITDKLAPKKPVNKMEGVYILVRPDGTHYSVLKKHYANEHEYTTVIPNAGYNREFAHNLISMLNAQGSEAPQN